MNMFKYNCEKCNKKYKGHSGLWKHKQLCKESPSEINTEIKECKYECNICNKRYNSQSGLWKHNKTCRVVIQETPKISNEIINEKIDKQNQTIEELKNLIIELTKKEQPAPITNNNNDNKLNINLFLNEQCKNAINMIDFVKTIVFELKDFENLLDKGFIENKTNIILENLNKLTLYERPLHYEKQEEVIHIRDDDKWKKETEKNNPIFENAMKELENNEYDDLYKTIKVTGVSHRGKPTVDYDVDKVPNFIEIKEILEKEDNKETKKIIISSILENVVLK